MVFLTVYPTFLLKCRKNGNTWTGNELKIRLIHMYGMLPRDFDKKSSQNLHNKNQMLENDQTEIFKISLQGQYIMGSIGTENKSRKLPLYGKNSKSKRQSGTRVASSNLKNGHVIFSHITAVNQSDWREKKNVVGNLEDFL